MVETSKLANTKFYTDRTAAETDDRCGQRFWWQRKEGGRGIVPKEEPFALLIGRQTHLDLATIANMEDISPPAIQAAIDEIVNPLTDEDRGQQKKMEVLYRRLGWLAAFALFIEPRIRADWETVTVEKEIRLERSPLVVGTTPDRILRNKRDSTHLVYKEYKTTISASKQWMDSWMYQIQLHLGIKAASEFLNERITFGQIMGLMKGRYTGDRLSHPYVWGWWNSVNDKWTSDYTKSRGNDWMPMPVWEFKPGVVEWVLQCGGEIANSQFPHSAPVFLNDRMLNDWIARRTWRERMIRNVEDISHKSEFLRSVYFEKRTGQCRPPFGDACPYLSACWNAEVNKDPLLHGDFVKREPHHTLEYMTALEDLEL